VQTAIEHNISKLEKNSPEKRVGLVTFNHKINIIGDGRNDITSIKGDQLNSLEKVKAIARNYIPTFDIIKRRKGKLREEILK
jgi:hypothetical protein